MFGIFCIVIFFVAYERLHERLFLYHPIPYMLFVLERVRLSDIDIIEVLWYIKREVLLLIFGATQSQINN